MVQAGGGQAGGDFCCLSACWSGWRQATLLKGSCMGSCQAPVHRGPAQPWWSPSATSTMLTRTQPASIPRSFHTCGCVPLFLGVGAAPWEATITSLLALLLACSNEIASSASQPAHSASEMYACTGIVVFRFEQQRAPRGGLKDLQDHPQK